MHFSKTASLAAGCSLALLGLFGAGSTTNSTAIANMSVANRSATPESTAYGEPSTKSSHAAADKRYQALLRPVDNNRVHGVTQFEVRDGQFIATVQATGLTPGATVPQHIHLNSTCGDAGDILINLDANLTVGGEGDPAGEAYPVASPRGVLIYQASRSLVDLEAALQENLGKGLEDLDLSSRVVNLHEPADGLPVNSCGSLTSAREY